MDIQHILQQITGGNRQAYTAVVEYFQRQLFGYLGRMGLSLAQAEEIAQETFLRAWQNLGQYDAKRSEFSTWLFTIARRLALNELERASTRLETPFTYTEESEEAEDTHAVSALTQLERQEQQQCLQQALRRLPLHERSTLALAYIQGLDIKTIARIEACSESAVKTRLHRAREQLRQWLGASA